MGGSHSGSATYEWGVSGSALKGTGALATTITLTGVSTPQQLAALYLNITNTDTKKSLPIAACSLTISYPLGKLLDHAWTFPNVLCNMDNTFTVTANTSAASTDSFEFKYSIDNGITYHSFAPQLIIGSSVGTTVTVSLPQLPGAAGVRGTVYMEISSINRTTNTQTQFIQIRNMYITTTEVGTGALGSVKAIQSVDMNNDGWPDIVICDSSKIYVLLNNGGNGQFTNVGQYSLVSSSLTGITDIGVGPLTGDKSINDILVATGTYLYIIDQTSIGVYNPVPIATTFLSGNHIAVGDVDGNGWLDVVVSSGISLDLYKNIGTSPVHWVVGTVPSDSINSICLGKFQNK